jgi:hypothetical protein
MSGKCVNIQGLADHVEALGYLCVFFANLERRVNMLLGQATGLKGDELACITNQVDFPKKLGSEPNKFVAG